MAPWPGAGFEMTAARTVWRWGQPLAGAAVLGALVWKLGTGPFLDGIAAVDVRALAGAVAIMFLSTVCCAWRWQLVARALGLELSLASAVTASYHSQFLNSVLPGGVLGDVHRGVAHGRARGAVGRGLRAVLWERAAGQLVLGTLAVAVLLLLPSPVHASPALLFVLALAAAAILVVVHLPTAKGSSWWARTLRTSAADIGRGLLSRHTWPGVVLASGLAVAGYAAVFLIAARAAGATAPVGQLLPLAVLVLAAMAVPANIAGWGPREGAAAWAFGAAGLGAAQGLSAAVVYGVLSLAACLPGAVVLVARWARTRRPGHGWFPTTAAHGSARHG